MTEEEDKKACRLLSKKKYWEIQDMLQEVVHDNNTVEVILERFRTIMKFDPNCSTYKKEMGPKILEYRKKRAEDLGVSTYKAFNMDKYYHARKAIKSTD